MDRQTLLEHLAQAEKHVVEGAALVEREHAILEELRRDGHPTADSEQLLRTMEETQQMHVAHLARIRQELSDLG
ncbi:MAG: hypothetical protein JO299_02075 [Gammaproteobacteria bacterium]|nr:hypothetical protein [Gammaproteobacteria bacterium]